MVEITRDALHSVLHGVGYVVVNNAARSVKQFEQFSSDLFSHYHNPATRIAARNLSHDGATSQVGAVGYLLGHSEAYYNPQKSPPDVCLFWCMEAPTSRGGETFIVNGEALLERLSADLRYKLEHTEVVYEMTWSFDRCRAEFGIEEIEDIKLLLSADTHSEFSVLDSDQLLIRYRTSAVVRDAEGKVGFINGILAHLPRIDYQKYAGVTYVCPQNRVFWEDGNELSSAEIGDIIQAHDSVLQKHEWNRFDLLLINNHKFLHGRNAMIGEGKRVIFSRFAYW